MLHRKKVSPPSALAQTTAPAPAPAKPPLSNPQRRSKNNSNNSNSNNNMIHRNHMARSISSSSSFGTTTTTTTTTTSATLITTTISRSNSNSNSSNSGGSSNTNTNTTNNNNTSRNYQNNVNARRTFVAPIPKVTHMGPSLMILRLALLIPLLTLGIILQAGLHATVPSHIPTSAIKSSASSSSSVQQQQEQQQEQGQDQQQEQEQRQHLQLREQLRQHLREHLRQKQLHRLIQQKDQKKEKEEQDSNNHDEDATTLNSVYYRILHKPFTMKKLWSSSETDSLLSTPSPLQSKTTTTTTTTSKQEEKNEHVSYHLIFSTGCSARQDWQSYVFFYHVLTSGQPGHVTRIVSGCRTIQEQQQVQTWFQQTILQAMLGISTVDDNDNKDDDNAQQQQQQQEQQQEQPRFHLHFTPDYGTIVQAQDHNNNKNNNKKKGSGQSYKYYNKPWGTKHWMEHALGYTFDTISTKTRLYQSRNVTIHTTRNQENPLHDDTIIILLDPDQIILRPFVNNDFSQEQWKFFSSTSNNKNNNNPKTTTAATTTTTSKTTTKPLPRTSIQHGAPMGQMYGFGTQWRTKINITELMGPLVYNDVDNKDDNHSSKKKKNTVASSLVSSPIESLSNMECQKSYIVGPPYIATARDFYAIVRQWSYFSVHVHEQYPYLLAEMFAYSLAAAHLQLPHQTAQSFMVSALEATQSEGWKMYIDPMMKQQIKKKTENRKTKSNIDQQDKLNNNDHQPNDMNDDDDDDNDNINNNSNNNNRLHLEAICANNQTFLQQEQDQGRLILPRVFHYCQRYNWGPYFFSKNKFPSNFISSCTFPLLAEPPKQLLSIYDSPWLLSSSSSTSSKSKKKTKSNFDSVRQTFGVCTMIHALNNAAKFYKHHHCFNDSSITATATSITTTNNNNNDKTNINNYNNDNTEDKNNNKNNYNNKANWQTNLVFTKKGPFASSNYTLGL